MKRLYVIIFGLLIIAFGLSMLSTPIKIPIQTCSSFVECIEQTPLREGDLLVLDIDLTLIAPTEPALLYPQIKQHRQTLKEITEWTPLLKMITLDLIPRRYSSQIIEQGVPGLIKTIQKQGIPVIALTASSVHPLGDQLLGPKMRYEQLKKHNIHLSNPTSSSSFELNDLEIAMEYYPSYYQGVLAANTVDKGTGDVINPKGEVLLSFIQHLPFTPKRVIFIDDRHDNLESVEKALQRKNIEFVGWEYRGGDFLSTKDITKEQFIAVWSDLIAEAQTIIDRYFSKKES